MRTTLNLPDALLLRLKAHAKENGRTVTSIVEEALVRALDDAASAASDTSADLVDFPVLGVPGGIPLMDLDDRHLLDALDGIPQPADSSSGGGSDHSRVAMRDSVPSQPEGSTARLVAAVRAHVAGTAAPTTETEEQTLQATRPSGGRRA